MGGLKASAQPWGFITHHIGACSLLANTDRYLTSLSLSKVSPVKSYCAHLKCFLHGQTVPYYSNNNCSYSFFGGESHYSFLCLGTVSSAFVSLCLCFSLILILPGCFYPSWGLVICLVGWFVLCGVGFFECVCVIFDLFYYFCHSIF